jgi:hypothetical protein
MKKIFALLILSIALFSCYDEYVNDFTYSSIYFSYQFDVRTVVVGEGMKVDLGVALSGVDGNKTDRNVSFSIDNSLITPAILTSMKGGANYIKSSVSGVNTLLPLPSNYYTLSDNSQIVIKSGQNSGSIVLKADSVNFLADATTLKANYAIGLNITSADADTILPLKRYSVVGLKYENMLFGKYWHGGVTTVKDAGGNVVQTIKYYTSIPTPENTIWTLTTVGPNALVSNGYSNSTTAKQELNITLNGTDIAISSGTGSTNIYLPDGASTFNAAKLLQNRKIFLNYKYVIGANTYYAQDTLTFRNRIRDGINEWQDENPSHYIK